MSKRIETLSLTKLLVATHYEYHRMVNVLIMSTTPAALKLEQLAPSYQAELDILFDVINRSRGSVLTQQIADLDRDRNIALGELFTIIDFAERSIVPDRKEAGLKLKRIIAPYRGIAGNEMNKKTAQIRGLLRDMGTDDIVDALDVLVMGVLVQSLRKTNNQVATLIEERAKQLSARAVSVPVTTIEQRRVVDEIYASIVERVNAAQVIESTPVIEKFIDDMNGYVMEYKKVISQMRPGGTGLEKGHGGEGEEEEIVEEGV